MSLKTAARAAAYRRDRHTESGGVAPEHENITVVEIELGKLAELMDAGELVRSRRRVG
jgi:hypothetical protein